MSGLGKERSKFGRYVDKSGIPHRELVKISKVSKDTVTKACANDDVELRDISKRALISAVNNLTGDTKKVSDFW